MPFRFRPPEPQKRPLLPSRRVRVTGPEEVEGKVRHQVGVNPGGPARTAG